MAAIELRGTAAGAPLYLSTRVWRISRIRRNDVSSSDRLLSGIRRNVPRVPFITASIRASVGEGEYQRIASAHALPMRLRLIDYDSAAELPMQRAAGMLSQRAHDALTAGWLRSAAGGYIVYQLRSIVSLSRIAGAQANLPGDGFVLTIELQWLDDNYDQVAVPFDPLEPVGPVDPVQTATRLTVGDDALTVGGNRIVLGGPS